MNNINNSLVSEEIIFNMLSTHIKNKQIIINNIYLYQKAFIHKSFFEYVKKSSSCEDEDLDCVISKYEIQNLIENNSNNNERFELLGDSVLKMVLTEYLFFRYKNENESTITKIRTQIENTETLSFLASKLNFNKFILVSHHSEQFNTRISKKILENTFESFLCALYLDQGMENTQKFLIHLIETYIDIDKYLQGDDVLYDIKDYLYKVYDKHKLGYPSFKLLYKMYIKNKLSICTGFFIEKSKKDIFESIFSIKKGELEQNHLTNINQLYSQLDKYNLSLEINKTLFSTHFLVLYNNGNSKKEVEKNISKIFINKIK